MRIGILIACMYKSGWSIELWFRMRHVNDAMVLVLNAIMISVSSISPSLLSSSVDTSTTHTRHLITRKTIGRCQMHSVCSRGTSVLACVPRCCNRKI